MSGTAWTIRLGLTMSLSGILAGAAAGAAEVQPGAQDPPPFSAPAAVTTQLGQPDWYVLRSTGLAIDSISGPRTCPDAPARLNVSLYNPEGRWMRRLQPDRGTYVVDAPAYQGRYLVRVGIYEQACAGLGYRVVAGPPRASPDPTPNNDCPGAQAKLKRAQKKLAAAVMYHRPRHGAPAALQANVTTAQALVKRYCHY